MVKFLALASALIAVAAPVAAQASAADGIVAKANVRQGYCTTYEVIHPDGSSDSVRECHTTAGGTT